MPAPLPAPLSGSWLTYEAAGERLGLSAEAVRTKARRAGWRRMPGNEGRTLVLLPEGVDERPPGRTPVHGARLEALGDAVALLGEQLQAERARADNDRVEIAAGRARADADRVEIVRLTGELAEKQAMAATAQAELAEQRARADKAEQRAEQAEEDRRQTEAERQAAEARADRAEQGRDGERARADAMHDRFEALLNQLSGVDGAEAVRQAGVMVSGLLEAHAGEVNALKEERDRLAAQLGGFALRGDQAEARAKQAEVRIDQAEARTDSLRARVDVLQRERDTARAEAVQAAEALRQAEAARQGRGLMARLRAAWRGE